MGRNGKGMRGCKSLLAARVSINGVSTVPSVPSLWSGQLQRWVLSSCRTGKEKRKKMSGEYESQRNLKSSRRKDKTRLKLAAKISCLSKLRVVIVLREVVTR